MLHQPSIADAVGATDRDVEALARALSEHFGVGYSTIFPRLLKVLLTAEEMELLLATPGDVGHLLGDAALARVTHLGDDRALA